jgi:aquaporin Z
MSQDTPDLTPTDSGDTAADRTPVSGSTAAPRAGVSTSKPAASRAGSADASVTPANDAAADASTDASSGISSGTDVAGDLVVLEPARPSLAARLGAEALGTFAIVLVGAGVLLYTPLSGAGSLGVALGLGFAFAASAVALGHVSGGHFNPAITFGAVVAGRAPVRDLLPYWLAQLVGGALAAAALYVTIPDQLPTLIGQEDRRGLFSSTANGFGDHSPLFTQAQGQVTFDLLPALLMELVLTAVLVAVVLGATSRRVSRSVAPVAMGLAYTAVALLALPITNAGLNPARSTGAALFSEGWALGQLWVFWLAPLVGAAIAGVAHRAFATDAGTDNLLEEDDLLVDEDSLLDDDIDDIVVERR